MGGEKMSSPPTWWPGNEAKIWQKSFAATLWWACECA